MPEPQATLWLSCTGNSSEARRAAGFLCSTQQRLGQSPSVPTAGLRNSWGLMTRKRRETAGRLRLLFSFLSPSDRIYELPPAPSFSSGGARRRTLRIVNT